MIHDNVLGAIGETPMIRLSKIGRGLDCELLGKCEFLNAGGSVKDRIGLRMVEDAEKQGRIKPGDTLIEPTSGNTGIGLALAAAVKGYRMVITLPEKMSREKVVVLEALGAQIVRTPTEAAWDSPESHIGVAKRLNEEIPHSHILDQYANPSNPDAHYDGTAREILQQCEGKLDMLVATAGTGGTITGIARRLKEEVPGVEIVGVDPVGSILAGPGEICSYKVEGIGYDFIPDVLDRSLIDRWIKTRDRESFLTARQLIREEGVLAGGSAGSCVWAALRAARDLKKGQRCVVILPDSVRNYMTKFMDDQWMKDNGFLEGAWVFARVQDLLSDQAQAPVCVDARTSAGEAVLSLKKHGFSQMPVTNGGGGLVGLVTESGLLHHMVSGAGGAGTPVGDLVEQSFLEVSRDTPLGRLEPVFEEGGIVLVTENEGDSRQVVSVLTKIDLLTYLMREKNPR
ncbi:MAG: cystathionine beta-synthase [Planctomycetota bacterium]|jgi:cystathionine beta-synthase